MVEDDSQRLARLKVNLQRRAQIYEHIRAFFKERDFLEVETLVRVPAVAPEEFIIPFKSEGWYLSTSPELHMKRLLAAGYDRIYQFSRCFRQGERGRWHNPEFVLLEWYRVGADYNDIVTDIEEMLTAVITGLGFKNSVEYQGQAIDVRRPWPRITVREAFLGSAGWDPVAAYDSNRFDVDFVAKVLPDFAPDRPTVLMDYPATAASLARLKPEDNVVCERAEVFIGGLELANAYSELTDAKEQEARFMKAINVIRHERRQSIELPDKFLEVLPHLPECGGVALGVDRLVMLLCNASSIDDVMAYNVDNA